MSLEEPKAPNIVDYIIIDGVHISKEMFSYYLDNRDNIKRTDVYCINHYIGFYEGESYNSDKYNRIEYLVNRRNPNTNVDYDCNMSITLNPTEQQSEILKLHRNIEIINILK